MKLDVFYRNVRRLRLRGNTSPLRKLLYTGLLKKLAERLILTKKNNDLCIIRNRQTIEKIHHYMVCLFPQRIFDICLPREDYISLIKFSADMCCCDATIYIGISYMKIYYNARGFSHANTNYQMAVDYLETAAYQGNIEAQYNFGKLLLDKDKTKAKEWLTHAARKEHVCSQFQLGQLCGLTKEGLSWYNLAADQGHTESQYILACEYESSNKYDDAVSWCRLAAPRLYIANVNLLYLLANHPDLRQETEIEFFKANASCDHMTLRKLWLERK